MKLKQFDKLDHAIIGLYNMSSAAKSRDKALVKLASYDHNPIRTLAGQLSVGKIGLTRKQKEFAVKLVTKYRKQLQKAGYDVSNVDMDMDTVLPLRELQPIDRVADIQDGHIILTFPYDSKVITNLHSMTNKFIGRAAYDKETKQWKIPLVHENMALLLKYSSTINGLKHTDAFAAAMEEHKTADTYTPILHYGGGKLWFENASELFIQSIDQKCGTAFADNKYSAASKLTTLALLQKPYSFKLDDTAIWHIMDVVDSKEMQMLLITGFAVIDVNKDTNHNHSHTKAAAGLKMVQDNLRQLVSDNMEVSVVSVSSRSEPATRDELAESHNIVVGFRTTSIVSKSYITSVLEKMPLVSLSTVVAGPIKATQKRYESYIDYKRRSKPKNNRS